MRVPREEGREVERETSQAAPPRQAPADRVLALQSTAGNRAVTAMLAREPDAPVQADAKSGPKDKKPATPSGPHIVLGELGAIALESWSISAQRSPGVGRGTGRGRDEHPTPVEIQLMTKQGAHSSRLAEAAIRGGAFDGEIVLGGGQKIIVKGALVTNYTVTDAGGKEPLESWTINVQSMEFVRPPAKDGDPKPDTSGYDLGDTTGS